MPTLSCKEGMSRCTIKRYSKRSQNIIDMQGAACIMRCALSTNRLNECCRGGMAGRMPGSRRGWCRLATR